MDSVQATSIRRARHTQLTASAIVLCPTSFKGGEITRGRVFKTEGARQQTLYVPAMSRPDREIDLALWRKPCATHKTVVIPADLVM